MAQSKTTGTRAYVAGRFALELDHMRAGWLYGFDGGMASGDVVSEKVGPDALAHKHLSPIKYDDITVTCGPAMSQGFYDWIKHSFDRNYSRRDGALVGANFDLKETSRLDFHNALVTEVGFPACDAGSKDFGKLQVKLTPEYSRFSAPHGSISGGYPLDDKVGKRWLARNFRVRIDGVDTSRVNKIEAITIKQKFSEVPVGEFRDAHKEPTSIEYPNVVLSLPEVNAKDFFTWYQSFVVDGKCDVGDEKHGSIEFLAEDVHSTICHIDLFGLGLCKLTLDRAEAGSESIRMVRVEMYCERMAFEIKGAYA